MADLSALAARDRRLSPSTSDASALSGVAIRPDVTAAGVAADAATGAFGDANAVPGMIRAARADAAASGEA
jgi:hypothetical protein